jgi:hypothetical protein
MLRTHTGVRIFQSERPQEWRGLHNVCSSADSAQGWDLLSSGLLESVLQEFARTGTHLPASLRRLPRSSGCAFGIIDQCIDCQMAGHQRL